MTDKLKKPVPGLEDFKPLVLAPSQFEKLAFPPEMDLPLVVTLLDAQYEREGRSTVVLNTGFQFHDKQTGRIVRVPRTYVTDFASIPVIVRGLIESFGRHARAAVLHDWLYAINEGKREDADKMAMRAMKALGVETWKRWAIYTAIRLFGGGGWANMREEWKITWANPQTGDRIGPKYQQSDFHGGNWPNDPDLGFAPPP